MENDQTLFRTGLNTFAFTHSWTTSTSQSVWSTTVITHTVCTKNVTHTSLQYAHASMILCCNSHESSVHFFQKQQTLQRLHAERLNSCFSDVSLTVLSPFVSFLFLRSLSHSFSAWAAESAHQINTERGIVFRLETAEQVTDNGNTWKCVNCGCRKKAIPMQISAGASLKSNLILEFNNSFKLFSRKKKTGTGFFWNDQYSSPCIPHLPEIQSTDGWGFIMKPILGPPNVIFVIKTSTRWRHWRSLGDMEAISWTPVSESFGLGLSGAVGKTQSGGGGRKSESKDCSIWPEVQTIDSLHSLSEPTTNPQLLFTVQMGASAERRCLIAMGEMGNSRSLTSVYSYRANLG